MNNKQFMAEAKRLDNMMNVLLASSGKLKRIRVCCTCKTPVKQVTEELLDYCPQCEVVVEGNTEFSQVTES